MEPFIYAIDLNGSPQYILSLLKSEDVINTGLPKNAMMGYALYPQGPMSPQNIQIFPWFFQLFQDAIKEWTLTTEGLHEEAVRQQNGFVYIFDARDRHYPETRPWDIIGSFPVKNGKLDQDAYKANPNYQIVSEDGLFRLPEEFTQLLMKKMKS